MECLDFESSLFLCSDDSIAQIVSTVKYWVLKIYELSVNFFWPLKSKHLKNLFFLYYNIAYILGGKYEKIYYFIYAIFTNYV